MAFPKDYASHRRNEVQAPLSATAAVATVASAALQPLQGLVLSLKSSNNSTRGATYANLHSILSKPTSR